MLHVAADLIVVAGVELISAEIILFEIKKNILN